MKQHELAWDKIQKSLPKSSDDQLAIYKMLYYAGCLSGVGMVNGNDDLEHELRTAFDEAAREALEIVLK